MKIDELKLRINNFAGELIDMYVPATDFFSKMKNATMKPKIVYPDEDSNPSRKVVRIDLQNKNDRFSNDFMQINNKYKNPKIRENYKPRTSTKN